MNAFLRGFLATLILCQITKAVDPAQPAPLEAHVSLEAPEATVVDTSLGTRSLPLQATLFDKCFLAAKGMGAGFLSLLCGTSVATGIKEFSSIHSATPTVEDRHFNKTWASIATLSTTIVLMAIAYNAGGYSLTNLKKLFQGTR